MKKLLPLFTIFFIFSCSRDYRVPILKLYGGISDISKVGEDKFAFLMNLKDYNGLIAVGYLSGDGELLKVQTIDKDRNVDVNSDFIRLIHTDNVTSIFYERRYRKFAVESFDSLGLVNEVVIDGRKNCYGTIFLLEDSSQSVYIKSEYRYNDGIHSDYRFNYIELDSDMSIKKKKVINLGSYYPMGMTGISGNIFYYIDGRKLFYYSDKTKQNTPIYQFTGDIIELKRVGDSLYVLLEDFFYIVNSRGEVVKEFKLHDNDSEYNAAAIVNTDKRGILVHFNSDKESLFRSFSVNGSQTGEFKIRRDDLYGDSYYIYRGVSNSLIYSTTTDLYLKGF